MKQKIKSFLVEKKELIIFISAIVFVFISVVAIASFAFKDNSVPVVDPTNVVTPTKTDDPVVEPTKTDEPVAIIHKFSLPVSGEYEMVRIFFDSSLNDEELASAIIDNGTTIETSSGISFAKSDNSSFDVLSIYEGEVIDVTTDEVLGCSVTIKHANNVKSIYSSLQDVTVEIGQEVTQGSVIGQASTSSNDISAGVHVYLQTMVNDKYINPASIMGRTLEELISEK